MLNQSQFSFSFFRISAFSLDHLLKSQSVFRHINIIKENVGTLVFGQKRNQLFKLSIFVFISPAGNAVQTVITFFGRNRSFPKRVNDVPEIVARADVFDNFIVPVAARLPAEIQIAAFDAGKEIFEIRDVFRVRFKTRRALKQNRLRFQSFGAGKRRFPILFDNRGRLEISGFFLFRFGQLFFEAFVSRAFGFVRDQLPRF